MKPLSRRNSLVALSALSSLGLATATCIFLTHWALNRTYPEARLLSRDGPSYHSSCRWYGCTWTVLTSSRFITGDDADKVYEWYWDNRRVWDFDAGRVHVRFAFLELGRVKRSPTRYHLETELLVVYWSDQDP